MRPPAAVQNHLYAMESPAAVQNHLYAMEAWQGRRNASAASEQGCRRYETPAAPELFKRYPRRTRMAPAARRAASYLYGTGFAQAAIWSHQHPSDCKQVRFLLFDHGQWGMRFGIGAAVHYVGRALGIAMDLGVVLAWQTRTKDPTFGWYERGHCRGSSAWECWLLPLTHCQPLGDAIDTITPESIRNKVWPTTDGPIQRALVPHMFHHMLRRCSPVKRSTWFYWWRAQATAYIMRLNSRTRQLMDARRSRLPLLVNWRGAAAPAAVDFGRQGLPPGSIAVHVRTSRDKTTDENWGGRPEMQRQPLERYLAEAERLAKGEDDIPVLHPRFADSREAFVYGRGEFQRRLLVVNPDDETELQAALELARAGTASSWDVAFFRANRTNEALSVRKRRFGIRSVVIESLVNLELFLEADAWICTLASSWCSLIDELRMTVAGKASSPYIDLMQLPARYAARGCPPKMPLCYSGW